MPGQVRSRIASILPPGLLLTFLSMAAQAQVRFDFPAQPLAQSLVTLGSLTHLNIYFDVPTVNGIQAPALKARLSPEDAIARLLEGTRLHVVRVDENTYRVVSDSEPKSAQTQQQPATGATHAPANLHLAAAGAAAAAAVDGIDGSPTSTATRIQEVLVTAQKRSERLQDVPVPVTAISAAALVDANQVRLQDYYNEVPGLSVTSQGFRDAPVIAIRGITTGTASNPTVGIIVDDVPYGASTNLGGGTLAPDIDPSDLDHIEVLRGPQGTLYGADSMGGLVKYVTIDPSVAALSGRLEAGTFGVSHGAQPGYQLRGSLNVPVSDTFAVRLSGFSRQDPGYIDNPVLSERGVNESWDSGGRAAALWKPTEAFSLKLSALLQESRTDGSPLVFPLLGDLQQDSARGTGWSRKRLQAYRATFDAKLGGIDLTAISGYNVNHFCDDIDFTAVLGALSKPFGVNGWAVPENNRTSKFTQEIRASIALGSRIQWLLGGFYNHESTTYLQTNLAVDPISGATAGIWGTNSFPSRFVEYAGFTDFTFQITAAFDVQVGGRESQIRQTYEQVIAGNAFTELFYGQPAPLIQPEETAKANSFTYLFTPRYRIAPDLMIYARLASGYRPGAINLGNTLFDLPLISKPDKTQNYELGAKGGLLDHKLSFDVSLYDIEWKDIQLTVVDPLGGATFYDNGSHARSRGTELSAQATPLGGFKVGAWLTLSAATLTQNMPPHGAVFGGPGDRLPYSSRFSGNVSLQQDFPVWSGATGYAAAVASYVGAREGEFTATSARQPLPGYSIVNFRLAAHQDEWAYMLYLDNAFDRRGVLSGGLGTYIPNAFTYIRPLTLGFTVSRTF